ncbi:MAG: hypothetical protein FJ240_01935 [Nitrospira sp.]|nr:hypothetical protein [Nitrospira sp.]
MKQLRNERGIALVMILVLSAISLAIMAALIYMITVGTQLSGMQKRYRTALDAGVGSADLAYQFVATRGDTTIVSGLLTQLSLINPAVTTSGSCTGTSSLGTSFAGLAAKLNAPTFNPDGTSNWSSACAGDSVMIIPGTSTSYDLRYDLGSSPYPVYRVYTKIVDTIEGNSGGDEGLLGKGVVSSGSGEISVMSRPYLYSLEVNAENLSSPSERAKLSVLYQY